MIKSQRVTVIPAIMQMRFRSPQAAAGGFTPADVPQSEADALIWLYNNTTGASWTNKAGWLIDTTVNNWYGVTVTGGHVTDLVLSSNNLNGNIGSWAVDDLPLTGATGLRLNTNASLSGDISGWTLPASLANLQLYSTSVSGAPSIASNTAMRQYYYHTCGLSQANVDAILLSVYNRRAAFTYATPALQVGGTNAAPSGVYQDGDPPTTGKEYAFEIVNDPETEGFKKWTVTFAA